MALKSELMAGGLAASLANKLGFDPLQTVTAAGTTQATATVLKGNASNVNSVASGAGVIIGRPNETNLVVNSGSNVLTVYPPVGSTMVGLALNAGFQIAPTKSANIWADGTSFIYNLSA